MAIDPNIIAGLQQPKFESPVNALAQMLQVQGAQQQNQMGQQKLDEYTRGIAGDNALSKLLAGGASPQDVATGLASQGYGKQAMAYTKQQQDAAKTAAETSHLTGQTGKLASETKGMDYDLERKKHDRALTEITSFNTPADALASLDAHVKSGELPPDQAEVMRKAIPTDPARFRAWQGQTVQGLLTAKDRAEYLAPTAGQQLTADTQVQTTKMTNDTSRSNNASTNATTQRGQNMTDARTREAAATAAAAPKGVITQTENGPMLVDPRTGSAVPITADGKPVGAAAKPLTESQGKATLFVSRMDKADKIMTGLNDSGTKNPALLGGVPLVGNFTANSNEQQLEQAQRDFVNATLRQESGAAIADSEFESAKKQYFPQRGDGAAVIAQKAANRKTAIAGMGVMAGAGPSRLPTSSAPTAPAKNAQGWTLHTDAGGNKAYVSPDGKQFQEVK